MKACNSLFGMLRLADKLVCSDALFDAHEGEMITNLIHRHDNSRIPILRFILPNISLRVE